MSQSDIQINDLDLLKKIEDKRKKILESINPDSLPDSMGKDEPDKKKYYQNIKKWIDRHFPI